MGYRILPRVATLFREVVSVAEIIEFKPRAHLPTVVPDVSVRVSEFMYAFHLLDHAELKTSDYHFDSRWQKGCRTWSVDGVEVNLDDFEEHLTEWMRQRALRRFAPAATVLPITAVAVSSR